MKNKRWPILLVTALVCLVLLIPVILFRTARTSAGMFMGNLDRSELKLQPELAYHSWDWQWGSNIILLRFVDKANVLQDSFGPYRIGVAWNLKHLGSEKCRFTVDAVR